MVVQLISGYGVRLSGLPDVTFGMSRQEVLATWSGKRVHRPFVCGMSWSGGIDLTGVDLGVFGDDEQRLGLALISRMTRFYENCREGLLPYEPVVFDDVDLFYWPAAELVDFLRASGRQVTEGVTITRVGRELELWRDPVTACFTSVTFWGPRATLAER
ncbi:hypothetical protein [Catellatospora vulcania]|uniref:hypothetical protein n=1 Tax=Catellatospora vulcania TaxID=1460450 RepID=UPI0012D3809F|nr:hypothetical protein [Catellatospora vulcania]